MEETSSAGARRPGRKIGRRRRRLYWTVALLIAAGLAGAAVIVAVRRAHRTEMYKTGEDLAAITRQLDLGIPAEAPKLRFTNVTQEAGLSAFRAFAGRRTSQLPEDMGSGAAWGDFDNDGDDDLLLVSAGGPLGAPEAGRARTVLYENRGDGTFTESAAFPETRIIGMGAAWGDVDGDGWLDLVVTGYGTTRLYRNDRGRLSRDPHFPDLPGFWSGAACADYDHDGDLDLYICGYVRYKEAANEAGRATQQYGQAVPFTLNPASFEPERNLLFRNDGRGRFEEVAHKLGVDNLKGRSLSALWHDFDDDGWVDLYVANDISDNALFMNRGGRRFEDVSHAAWVADYRGAMGLAAGDWNRDGDDDLFISHWMAQENALYDNLLRDLADSPDHPKGALRFQDVADQRGLGQIALQSVGWGTEFGDFDADGWLDLVVANGSTFETELEPKELRPQESFLFWNNRGKSFHNLAPLDPAVGAAHLSRGLALADYDNDGDLDILIVDRDGPVRLLRNDMQSGNWLEVRLVRAAGVIESTRLAATVQGAVLRRSVSSASYLSQSTRTVHFGLGPASRVDKLVVRWPGAGSDNYENLDANAIWEIREGDPLPRKVKGGSGAALSLGTGAEPIDAWSRTAPREQVAAFWRSQRAAMNAMKGEKDPKKAIALFEEALRLNPQHEDSVFYLASCLAATGKVDGALARLAELMRANPMSHRARQRWGTLRARTARSPADLDEAVRVLERAEAINPEETGVRQVLGEIALVRGDRKTARRHLERVVRTNVKGVGGLYLLAYLDWKAGDTSHATVLLKKAREKSGPDGKPSGATSEGDVQRAMHEDQTLLSRFYAVWDGSSDADRAFRALDAHLAESKF